MLTLDDALDAIEEDCLFIMSRHQISADVQRELERLVRSGAIKRAQVLWPWIDAGTVRKTAYFLPNSYADKMSAHLRKKGESA